MNIKELHIGHFGKLKDLPIQFSPGLNIIYGENEAGKTTIQAFIKAMFYGLNARPRNIRDNERKRYIPWDGDRAFGTLTFEDHDGVSYTIKKSFGEQKRQDEQIVFHSITGQKAVDIDFEKPGETVFGIGEEAFEKTVCIKQLSAQIIRDKDDEIMQRLTNLQQTGDEDLSYHKAVGALSETQKGLENKRKTGQLDKLKVIRETLKEEYRAAVQRHEEMIEDEIRLKEWEDKKLILLEQIQELEKQKKRSRKYNLYKEYKRLIECREKIQLLSQEKQQLEQNLTHNGEIISPSFISNLDEKYILWSQLKKDYKKMKTSQQGLEDDITDIKSKLKNLLLYEDLDEKEINNLLSYVHENKLLKDRLKECFNIEAELKKLEAELSVEEKIFREISVAKEIKEDFETDVYQARDRLRTLEYKQSDQNTQKESLRLKKDILLDKTKGSSIQIIIGILAALGGGILGWIQKPIFYGLAIIGLLWCLMVFRQKSKFMEEIKELEKEFNRNEADTSLEEELAELTDFLEKAYKALGAEDFEDFKEKIDLYRQQERHLNTFRTKIEAKKAQWENMGQERLQEKLSKQGEYINSILQKYACQTIDELLENRKSYTEIAMEKNNLEKQKSNNDISLIDMQEELQKLERKILDQFEGLDVEIATMEGFEEAFVQLSEKFARNREIQREIESATKLYEAICKGRHEESIREELGEFVPTGEDELIGDEGELDAIFNQKHQELFILQDQISDLTNKIKNKEKEGRSVTQIEEAISKVNEDIEYSERKLKALDAALKGLEDAFREIQKDFGPKLNQKTGAILGRITNGKYNDLKISEDYDIRVTDPTQLELREIDYFSNGTWDQIYIALRLGIIQMIFEKDKSPFLMLDDAFVQYDDIRLGQVWDYLYEYANENQILLFTCQRREVEKLKQYKNANLILL